MDCRRDRRRGDNRQCGQVAAPCAGTNVCGPLGVEKGPPGHPGGQVCTLGYVEHRGGDALNRGTRTVNRQLRGQRNAPSRMSHFPDRWETAGRAVVSRLLQSLSRINKAWRQRRDATPTPGLVTTAAAPRSDCRPPLPALRPLLSFPDKRGPVPYRPSYLTLPRQTGPVATFVMRLL